MSGHDGGVGNYYLVPVMQKKIIFSLALFIFISGCAPVYYPNSRNIPSANKANEAQFAGMGGLNGWDVTALYNFHKIFGVMANGSFAHNTRKSKEDQIEGPRFHRHLFGEAGIGYYKGFRDRRTTIAFYSGIGWGNSFSDNINLAGNIIFQKATYHRYFLQPSVSLDLKYMNLGYGFRFSNLGFQKFETQAGLQDMPNNEWFIESVTEISAKMDDFDFVVQGGFNAPLNNEKVVDFHYRAFHASVGVRYNLTRQKDPDLK